MNYYGYIMFIFNCIMTIVEFISYILIIICAIKYLRKR